MDEVSLVPSRHGVPTTTKRTSLIGAAFPGKAAGGLLLVLGVKFGGGSDDLLLLIRRQHLIVAEIHGE